MSSCSDFTNCRFHELDSNLELDAAMYDIMIEFFRKFEKSKWLAWVSLAPFVIFLLAMMFSGEILRGLAILTIFGSVLVGVAGGGLIGKVAGSLILQDTGG